jgi:hypothetical protein
MQPAAHAERGNRCVRMSTTDTVAIPPVIGDPGASCIAGRSHSVMLAWMRGRGKNHSACRWVAISALRGPGELPACACGAAGASRVCRLTCGRPGSLAGNPGYRLAGAGPRCGGCRPANPGASGIWPGRIWLTCAFSPGRGPGSPLTADPGSGTPRCFTGHAVRSLRACPAGGMAARLIVSSGSGVRRCSRQRSGRCS